MGDGVPRVTLMNHTVVTDLVSLHNDTELLVGDASRGPRIADYAGRGDLRRWLRAAQGWVFLEITAIFVGAVAMVPLFFSATEFGFGQ